MPYGTIKVDTVTFTNAGVDKSVTLSGLVQNPVFSGNVTVTGTLSGVTVTGTTANFTSGNFTNISGGTHTITSGVFAAGSAASPSITFTGDLNTGIYSPGADQVAVATNGTGRLFINDGGQIGIGTNTSLLYPLNIQSGSGADAIMLRGRLVDDKSTILFVNNGAATNLGWIQVDATGFAIATGSAPTERLRIDATGQIEAASLGTAAAPTFSWTGDPNTGIYSPGADQVAISTGGSGRLFVDASGLLSVGTSTAAPGSTALAGRFATSTGTGSVINIQKSNDGTNAANIHLLKSRGTVASPTVVSNGDTVGSLTALAYEGSSFATCASVDFAADGAIASTDAPGRITFSTRPAGAGGANTERLRITSAGLVGVGTSSPESALHVNGYITVGYPSQNQTSNNLIQVRSQSDPADKDKAAINLGTTAGATSSSSFIEFFTNNYGVDRVARMRIDPQGRVGIGTTSPAARVHSDWSGGNQFRASNGSATFDILNDSTNSLLISSGPMFYRTGTFGPHIFQYNNGSNEALRIDSSGRLGVGTSLPNTKLHVADGEFTISTGGNASDSGGIINFGITTFSTFSPMATIQGLLSNASGTELQGGLGFFTRPAGTAGQTLQRRMTISSQGNVGIGTTSPGAALNIGADGDFWLASSVNTVEEKNLISWRIEDGSEGARISAFREAVSNAPHSIAFFTRTSGGLTNEKARITSAGNVGIGTASPARTLQIQATSASFGISNTGGDSLAIDPPSGGFAQIDVSGANALRFNTNGSERARLTASGQLLVGTSSARSTYLGAAISAGINVEAAGNLAANNRSISVVNGFAGSTDGDPIIYLGRTRSDTVGGTTIVQNADNIGRLEFVGSDGTNMLSCARIMAFVDGTPGANDMPGRLVFSTTADGASSPTERMRITQNGYAKHANNGIYLSNTAASHEFSSTDTEPCIILRSTNASFANNVLQISATRAANSAYRLFAGYSDGFNDLEFGLYGDGNGKCDGSWTGGGADYAEFFEWSDSNPNAEDRRGISVVLDGDKIREAVAGEEPIGVISGNPSVVGDAAWNKWSGKYLRDEFGTYIQEDYEVADDDGNTVIQQRRKLNPAYDPEVEYVSREERPEWDCVGLMGKLRIRKGQITGSRWIKMRDISATVEEWLVR